MEQTEGIRGFNNTQHCPKRQDECDTENGIRQMNYAMGTSPEIQGKWCQLSDLCTGIIARDTENSVRHELCTGNILDCKYFQRYTAGYQADAIAAPVAKTPTSIYRKKVSYIVHALQTY